MWFRGLSARLPSYCCGTIDKAVACHQATPQLATARRSSQTAKKTRRLGGLQLKLVDLTCGVVAPVRCCCVVIEMFNLRGQISATQHLLDLHCVPRNFCRLQTDRFATADLRRWLTRGLSPSRQIGWDPTRRLRAGCRLWPWIRNGCCARRTELGLGDQPAFHAPTDHL